MTLPTYFISHGGGPWPWLPDWKQMLRNLETALQGMPAQIGEKPKAVLMVSGHWETPDFSVMSSAKPPMVYDYHGFPRETYDIVYPAPGAPALAQRTMDLIKGAGLPTQLDDKIGFDHGTFVPMYVMWPDASVPTYQVSLKKGYDPEIHVKLGRALKPLRDEGVLIIGSGLSYHNLRLFGPQAKEPSTAFDNWLNAAMDADPKTRVQQLLSWEKAPSARVCHPQEDHLVPLMVAVGAAENEKAKRVYHDVGLFDGVTASSYRFG